jgi:hypothetical protein
MSADESAAATLFHAMFQPRAQLVMKDTMPHGRHLHNHCTGLEQFTLSPMFHLFS